MTTETYSKGDTVQFRERTKSGDRWRKGVVVRTFDDGDLLINVSNSYSSAKRSPENVRRYTPKWKRIAPGYYQLEGTDIEVANMKGQDVGHSGWVPLPWEVRRDGKVIDKEATMAEAKAKGWALYEGDR